MKALEEKTPQSLQKRTEEKTPSLIDTKGLGKPSTFGKGDRKDLESKFLAWSRKTKNFILSVYPDMEDILD